MNVNTFLEGQDALPLTVVTTYLFSDLSITTQELRHRIKLIQNAARLHSIFVKDRSRVSSVITILDTFVAGFLDFGPFQLSTLQAIARELLETRRARASILNMTNTPVTRFRALPPEISAEAVPARRAIADANNVRLTNFRPIQPRYTRLTTPSPDSDDASTVANNSPTERQIDFLQPSLDLIANAIRFCARSDLKHITQQTFLLKIRRMMQSIHQISFTLTSRGTTVRVPQNALEVLSRLKETLLEQKTVTPWLEHTKNQSIALTILLQCLVGHFHTPSSAPPRLASYMQKFPTARIMDQAIGSKSNPESKSYLAMSRVLWDIMTDANPQQSSGHVRQDLYDLWQVKKRQIVHKGMFPVQYLVQTTETGYEEQAFLPEDKTLTWSEWYSKVISDTAMHEFHKGKLLLLMLGVLYVNADNDTERIVMLRGFTLLEMLIYTDSDDIISELSKPYQNAYNSSTNQYIMPFQHGIEF